MDDTFTYYRQSSSDLFMDLQAYTQDRFINCEFRITKKITSHGGSIVVDDDAVL